MLWKPLQLFNYLCHNGLEIEACSYGPGLWNCVIVTQVPSLAVIPYWCCRHTCLKKEEDVCFNYVYIHICIFVSFNVIQIPLKNSMESSLEKRQLLESFVCLKLTKTPFQELFVFSWCIVRGGSADCLLPVLGNISALNPCCRLRLQCHLERGFKRSAIGLIWPAEYGRQLESKLLKVTVESSEFISDMMYYK